jgi:hypothetical protein
MQGVAGPAVAGGAEGPSGAPGVAGVAGAPGLAASDAAAAAILHSRLITAKGRSFTVHYLAGKGARLVLTVRTRGGRTAVRLAALTTRKAGRGSIRARHVLAPGAYTLVLTALGAGGARVVDAVPLLVRKA